MKFIGFSRNNKTHVGVMAQDGSLVPIAEVGAFYAALPKYVALAQQAQREGQGLKEFIERPAVPASARVFCVGLNYRAHAAEGGRTDLPEHPTIFGRWTQSLNCSSGEVPALEERLDWEGELAVVIGAQACQVSEAQAVERIFGYAPFNDISARTYQRHTPQWTLGKNGDGTGVMGAIVTKDEVGDPATGLQLRTILNGAEVQNGSTRDMVYPIPGVIAYLSEILTLHPGDVIATGTPEGVGAARKPPVFLKPSDIIEVQIEKVGSLRNRIVERKAWVPK